MKICGLTNQEDARAALETGADLLGFNTWSGSKRYLDLEAHASWLQALPPRRVALLVNATLDEARRIAALPYVDALQLHGDEDAAYCSAVAGLGKPIIKALRVSTPADFATAGTFSTPHVLLDAQVTGAYGGTGVQVNADLVRQFTASHPNLALWLAGGLRPDNVAKAVRATRPRVVDVSSGVESRPGVKDFAKLQAFSRAAREA